MRDHSTLPCQVGAVTQYQEYPMRSQRLLACAFVLFAAATANAAPPAHPVFQPISTETMSQVQGDYQLSNGHRVRLAESNGRLYAVLGKHDQRELLATGADTFSTRDRSITLRFQPGVGGDRVVLSSMDSSTDRDRALARVFDEAQRNKQAALSVR